MASTFLTRTIASATGTTKGTFSCWVKRSGLTDGRMFSSWGSGTSQFWIIFSSNKISIADYDGSYNLQYVTNRLFRDTSAWYHIVVAIDTTLGTSGDRVKLYVNGVQETSFSTSTAPSQDQVLNFSNNGEEFRIGKRDSEEYLDGSMTHIHFTDGYAYAASDFGETDSTSGIWKPKTSPSVTYGNNGFFLKMENSGAMGTDSSGNSNTFTVSGTLTQNVDTPSNVFCTLNAINPYSGTLSNGNLKISQSSYDYNTQGTLGMTSGKYYWEVKMGGLHGEMGICEQGKAGQTDPQSGAGFYFIYSNGSGGVVVYNNVTGSNGTTNSGWTNFASGQIIGVAYDADNGKLYFHNNGTYYNSGNPASGTGALITGISPQYGGIMVPFLGSGTSSARTHEINFGNGYFGTTAVTTNSGNGYQDSDGNGKMNYSVPSGYKILCTKGINSF